MTQTHELAGKTVVVTRATSWQGREPQGGCTLAPAMAETAAIGEPSRIVNISSSGHRGGHIDIDDLQESATSSVDQRVYNTSKSSLTLLTAELASQ